MESSGGRQCPVRDLPIAEVGRPDANHTLARQKRRQCASQWYRTIPGFEVFRYVRVRPVVLPMLATEIKLRIAPRFPDRELEPRF
jgi:hypothetical protein